MIKFATVKKLLTSKYKWREVFVGEDKNKMIDGMGIGRLAGRPAGVGKEKRGGRESVRRKETNHSDGSVACSL